jgi:hypothetical protein
LPTSGVRAIGLCRVEEVDAPVYRRAQHLDAFTFIDSTAGAKAQIHGPHAEGRNAKTTGSKLTHFHDCTFVILRFRMAGWMGATLGINRFCGDHGLAQHVPFLLKIEALFGKAQERHITAHNGTA